jgi:plasmid stabilization system protein ParE
VKQRQIALTDVAVNDILEQAAWYQEKSGVKLAQRWEQAVSSILLRMAKNPAVGAHAPSKPSN